MSPELKERMKDFLSIEPENRSISFLYGKNGWMVCLEGRATMDGTIVEEGDDPEVLIWDCLYRQTIGC